MFASHYLNSDKGVELKAEQTFGPFCSECRTEFIRWATTPATDASVVSPCPGDSQGWFTTDPWGRSRFWPASKWEMRDEVDCGQGWEHPLVRRSDGENGEWFPRGFRITTAKMVDGVLTVTPGWQPIFSSATA